MTQEQQPAQKVHWPTLITTTIVVAGACHASIGWFLNALSAPRDIEIKQSFAEVKQQQQLTKKDIEILRKDFESQKAKEKEDHLDAIRKIEENRSKSETRDREMKEFVSDIKVDIEYLRVNTEYIKKALNHKNGTYTNNE